ncbi:hypothetical protein [Hydrotalea sp.]|uniref:hypothetical protein n=1 Tax=Hydrotalea sp. TaxID=2881279 RepID=UPI002636CFD7|nr:hypothetical protein [Hydrotalea sp.]
MNKLNDIMVSAALLWIGFTASISFMEAWLKFRAKGVTIPIGLGIGRLVFGALNKVEWLFSIMIILGFIYWFITGNQQNKNGIADLSFTFGLILFILIVETFWLLPGLDKRARLIISGQTLPASSLHIYFIGVECIKIGVLFYFATQLFLFKQK